MLYARTIPAVEWHIGDDLRALLLESNALRLDQWRRDGQLTDIKNSPHRAVFRVRMPGLDLHIKRYAVGDWRSRGRELLRGCKARREFEMARQLAARGIATPEPLGWARETGPGGARSCWLISRTMEGQSLLQALEANDPTSSARPDRLGEFLSRLHRAGVVHHDLHPGNILVTSNGDLALLDLHCVRLSRRLSWRQCRDNLVVLNRYFILRASRTARRRFWQTYSATPARVGMPADQAGRDIERRTLASNARFWNARDRRCLAANRYYRRIKSRGARGWCVADLDPELIARLAGSSPAPPNERVLKSGRSSTVTELTAQVSGKPVPAILKRFHRPGTLDAWLALLRRTPALRSWVNGHALRERCLPTARPLAVMQHNGRHGSPATTTLLTEKIENAVELSAAIDGLKPLPDAVKLVRIREIISVVAGAIRQLHDRGIAHRDLKAANILIETEPGAPRAWFIDLAGVQRCAKVRFEARAANIMRLNASFAVHPLVTRADRLRFLRAYLQWGLRGRGGWKAWWRIVAAKTTAKIARNQRAGRPLA